MSEETYEDRLVTHEELKQALDTRHKLLLGGVKEQLDTLQKQFVDDLLQVANRPQASPSLSWQPFLVWVISLGTTLVLTAIFVSTMGLLLHRTLSAQIATVEREAKLSTAYVIDIKAALAQQGLDTHPDGGPP